MHDREAARRFVEEKFGGDENELVDDTDPETRAIIRLNFAKATVDLLCTHINGEGNELEEALPGTLSNALASILENIEAAEDIIRAM